MATALRTSFCAWALLMLQLEDLKEQAVELQKKARVATPHLSRNDAVSLQVLAMLRDFLHRPCSLVFAAYKQITNQPERFKTAR
jgi:hypothetical protein